jgi:hypothetical protein
MKLIKLFRVVEPRLRSGRSMLLGLMVGAIMINIVEFPDIEIQTPFPAIHSYETSDLVEITISQSAGSSTMARYGPYLLLSRVAPGADIILPMEMPLEYPFTTEDFYGFGRAANVKILSYDPESVGSSIKPADHVVDSLIHGDDRTGPGPVAIAITGEMPVTLIAVRRDDLWYLVDSRLLPDDILEVTFSDR